jgi:RNA polymerase sigma-70 factor (sigma-E family)
MTTEVDFVEFARATAPRLRQTAYLLCRDWHLAQDFTQITLAKMFVHWRRIARNEYPEAYSRKMLLRVFLDHQRRRSSREVVIDAVPEAPVAGNRAGRGGADGFGSQVELRLTLIDALGRIPPRDRAIVVLRYWEDQSIETVASMLGISPGTVKTQSSRTLARLRTLLGNDYSALLACQD